MNDISELLDKQLYPQSALLIYGAAGAEEVYVEAYDIDSKGRPVNAHPLALDEATRLANALDANGGLNRNFLHSKNVLPLQVLTLNPVGEGYAVWYTPQQEVSMLFADALGIPNGKAYVPALLWKADRERLHLYALASDTRPGSRTVLYYAPFFNMYDNASVCMGTVDLDFTAITCLEEFRTTWETYFWNSYFSHTIGTTPKFNGNIVQLWQQQVGTGRRFPTKLLVKNALALQSIL